MQSLTQHLSSIDRAAHRIAAGLSAEISDSYAEVLSEDSEALELPFTDVLADA
jgi:hypothetical protein